MLHRWAVLLFCSIVVLFVSYLVHDRTPVNQKRYADLLKPNVAKVFTFDYDPKTKLYSVYRNGQVEKHKRPVGLDGQALNLNDRVLKLYNGIKIGDLEPLECPNGNWFPDGLCATARAYACSNERGQRKPVRKRSNEFLVCLDGNNFERHRCPAGQKYKAYLGCQTAPDVCSKQANGSKFPGFEQNDTSFVVCEQGLAVSHDCAPGLKFDPTLKACVSRQVQLQSSRAQCDPGRQFLLNGSTQCYDPSCNRAQLDPSGQVISYKRCYGTESTTLVNELDQFLSVPASPLFFNDQPTNVYKFKFDFTRLQFVPKTGTETIADSQLWDWDTKSFVHLARFTTWKGLVYELGQVVGPFDHLKFGEFETANELPKPFDQPIVFANVDPVSKFSYGSWWRVGPAPVHIYTNHLYRVRSFQVSKWLALRTTRRIIELVICSIGVRFQLGPNENPISETFRDVDQLAHLPPAMYECVSSFNKQGQWVQRSIQYDGGPNPVPQSQFATHVEQFELLNVEAKWAIEFEAETFESKYAQALIEFEQVYRTLA